MGNCGCVYVDTSTNNSCLRQKLITARKECDCCECGEKIPIGTQYEDYVGICEGEMFWCKTCLDCLSIRKSFFCDGFEFEGMIERLEEHIIEMGGDISSDCITTLTKGAKGMVCDMIEEYWEGYDDGE